MMDRKDRWDPYPLDQIAATTSGTSPPAQETPPNDLLSSIFDFAMIFWSFISFQFLIGLVVCQLLSTGIEFDEGSKENGYLV
jgi:hypothetical protein